MVMMLTGCAAVQFPKLGSAPERPSVKSNWHEAHTRETLPCPDGSPQPTKETDEFKVDHSDSRPATGNPIANFFSWLVGLGAIGTFLWFGGGTLLVVIIGGLIKRFLEIRKALWETVEAIKKSGMATVKGSPLNIALEDTHSDKTKDIVDDIRNKI